MHYVMTIAAKLTQHKKLLRLYSTVTSSSSRDGMVRVGYCTPNKGTITMVSSSLRFLVTLTRNLKTDEHRVLCILTNIRRKYFEEAKRIFGEVSYLRRACLGVLDCKTKTVRTVEEAAQTEPAIDTNSADTEKVPKLRVSGTRR